MDLLNAPDRRPRRWAATVGAAAIGCLLAHAPAPAAEGTLREAYQRAEQLAQSPDGAEAARAGYRAVIEAHLANEAVFQDALKQLAASYEKSGQIEESIRYFAGQVDRMERSERGNALREIFTAFRLKHPDELKRVIDELRGNSRTLPSPPASADDLAQAILQRDDAPLRSQALDKLQQMLAADTPATEKTRALATLAKALTAKFDRTPFRDLVVPLLESDDASVRWLAVRCLPALEPEAGDLDRVARLADDPAPRVRAAVGGALIGIGKGERGEVVIPALMKLLRDPESEVVEQTIRSQWGQYSSPEYDALAIELSREPRYHHNAIYFILSTMRDKSLPVCRRLVEELDDPDWNNSYRAAWGLTYGVPAEAKTLVEEGLLRALPEETNPQTRKQEFRALADVASEKSREYLTSVVESSAETEEFKEMAREILAGLGNRDENP